MKKAILIIVLFTLGFLKGNAQILEQKIEDQFLSYSKLLIDKKYDEALNYTDEELFKIIPRAQLLALVEKSFASTEMEIRLNLPTVSNFQKLINVNGKNYVKFISSMKIEMKIIETEEDKIKSEDDKESSVLLYQSAFENEFGAENVQYNIQSKFFEIQSIQNIIASSIDKEMSVWKFITIDSENENQKKIFQKFIPKEVLE